MPDGGTPALPGWPRALKEAWAAAYVGLSLTTFRQVVAPVVPAKKLSTGRIGWDRAELDAWIETRPTCDVAVDAAPRDDDAAKPEAPHDPISAALANLTPSRRSRGPRPAR